MIIHSKKLISQGGSRLIVIPKEWLNKHPNIQTVLVREDMSGKLIVTPLKGDGNV